MDINQNTAGPKSAMKSKTGIFIIVGIIAIIIEYAIALTRSAPLLLIFAIIMIIGWPFSQRSAKKSGSSTYIYAMSFFASGILSIIGLLLAYLIARHYHWI
jgi:predicted membrane protein